MKARRSRSIPSHRTYLSLAIPNILTNLTVPFAGLVDIALLGHLDQVEALGGVALGTIFFDYLYWSFGFLRMSTTALVAKFFGAQDPVETRHVVLRSVAVAVAVGCLILLLKNWLLSAGFILLQGEADVESAGGAYVSARIWGAPAALCGYVIQGYLLGRQRVKAALVLATVLNGCNIALDILFIGVLKWGPEGAGLATMASEWLALALGIWLVKRDWPNAAGWNWRDTFQTSAFGRLFTLQGNIMIRTFCLISSFAVFTNFSALFGTLFLTASAILLKLLGMAAYFIDGYAFALESLAGAYAGGRKLKALRRSFRLSMAWNLASVMVFVAIFNLFGSQIVGALTQHQEVVDETLIWMPMLNWVLLFSGFAYIFDGLFIGLAKGRELRNSMLISTCFVFLPIALWAWHTARPDLLWLSLILFMVSRSITLALAAQRLFRRPRQLLV